MRSYKRYTRPKRLLKHIVVVALVFILGLVLLRAVSYIAIQGEIPMINSFNLFRREADTSKCSSDAVYTWLANNAYKYGFIKRYPDDKTEITGVNNEPWHYRYVGVDSAIEIQEKGLCLEEYIESLR